jgi:nucleoid-associated protein YgaU
MAEEKSNSAQKTAADRFGADLAARQAELEKATADMAAAAAAEKARAAAEKAAEAAKHQVLSEHTVAAGETLSAIALKHYGSAAEPYWRHIYNENKESIGPNPGMVRAGTVLKIVVLPPELKK